MNGLIKYFFCDVIFFLVVFCFEEVVLDFVVRDILVFDKRRFKYDNQMKVCSGFLDMKNFVYYIYCLCSGYFVLFSFDFV